MKEHIKEPLKFFLLLEHYTPQKKRINNSFFFFSLILIILLSVFTKSSYGIEKKWFRVGVFWRISKELNKSFIQVYKNKDFKWGDGIFYNNSLISLKKFIPTKIEVSFRCDSIPRKRDAQAFFYFRILNRNDYYAIRIRINSDIISFIDVYRCIQKVKSKKYKIGNFKFMVLETEPINLSPLKWYKLKINITPHKIIAFVNNKKAISYTTRENLYIPGKVGLAVRDGLYSFDEYKLYHKEKLVFYDDFNTFKTVKYVKVRLIKVKEPNRGLNPLQP